MNAINRTELSLAGLSVGDAFGELFFSHSPHTSTLADLPKHAWRWTDDTHMALSIVEVLKRYGQIDQDALAKAFARRFAEEPWRGYAGGAVRLLSQIALGADWREMSPALFNGGSFGNGGAMRAAPIGAYFAEDVERAIEAARKSAMITHAHAEGQAGAIAVAVAAALAVTNPQLKGSEFLMTVVHSTPDSVVRHGIQNSINIPADDLYSARSELGTGDKVSAQDTVPFCLWSAAHHLHDFEAALWWTAKGMGDVDTTCAIVGGIVALAVGEVPEAWLRRREPLPKT